MLRQVQDACFPRQPPPEISSYRPNCELICGRTWLFDLVCLFLDCRLSLVPDASKKQEKKTEAETLMILFMIFFQPQIPTGSPMISHALCDKMQMENIGLPNKIFCQTFFA